MSASRSAPPPVFYQIMEQSRDDLILTAAKFHNNRSDCHRVGNIGDRRLFAALITWLIIWLQIAMKPGSIPKSLNKTFR